MRWVLRIVVALFVVLLVAVGVEQYAAESGEVVVLTTTDTEGSPLETRLWVVDHEGDQYLRAGNAAAGWYQRLVADNEVEVVRDGNGAVYLAAPDSSKTETVNDLMADKYGWADSYIGAIFPRDNAIAIRLEPVAAE